MDYHDEQSSEVLPTVPSAMTTKSPALSVKAAAPLCLQPSALSCAQQPPDLFCARCSTIKFREALSAPNSYVHSDISGELSPSEDVDGESACPICQMMAIAHPVKRTSRRLVVWPVDSEYSRLYFNLAHMRSLLGPFCFDVDTAKDSHTKWPDRGAIAVLAGRKSNSDILENAKRIFKSPQVDFEILRKWMESCQSNHLTSCVEDSGLRVTGLRLIDVDTREIVEVTGSVKYAALSYVWGQEEHIADKDTITVPNPAPNTVEDAMKVSKELGLKYLWIDRYCISQRHEEHRHSQIIQMHLIYNNAFVTIIAACGNGPDHGLPGVMTRPRRSHPFAVIDGRMLVATMPHPKSAIERSVWATRGWTYQEAILSRRRLFFTDHQVYFECNGSSANTAYDNVLQRLLNAKPPDLPPPIRDRKVDRRPTFRTPARLSANIFKHIEDYSKRKFSVQADRFYAFQGLLQSFTKANRIRGHIWGIPVFKDTTDFLEHMCWTLNAPSKRCGTFPSWSWVGWQGVVQSEEPDLQDSLWLDEPSIEILSGASSYEDIPMCIGPIEGTTVSFKLRKGGSISLDELCNHCQRGEVPKLSRLVQIVAPVLHLEFEYGSTKKNWWAVTTLAGVRLSLRVVFDIRVNEGSPLFRKLLTERCPGLILKRDRNDVLTVLVLERHHRFSERIGWLKITPDDFGLKTPSGIARIQIPMQRVTLR